ncbi:MAG: response regulator [Planctomycetes bacterium]|nr:response regulator [Planctomycetota bacterium]
MDEVALHILVVEDNASYRMLIEHSLKNSGIRCRVDLVGDGDSCLRELGHANYDLVLLDYGLPGANGLEVLRTVRVKHPQTPVVMVTGMGSEQVAVEAMKLGARDYLVKTANLARTIPLTIRKVMDRVQLEGELRETTRIRKHLEDVDRLKSELLANVSHELRTPLVSVVGYTEMVREGRLGVIPAEARRALDIAARNLEVLRRLIDSLLLHAGLECGRRPLHRTDFPIRRSLLQAVESLRPLADGKGVALHLDLGDEEVLVDGDEGLLAQVFTNLLTNALKFTAAGGTVTARCCGTEGEHARLEVCDTGCGIPPHMQKRVFERFWQVDGSLTRKHGGLGLGLAIVKEILEMHGGRIAVRSEVGVGSTFSLELPLAQALPTAPVASTPAPAGHRLRAGDGHTILAIDDEADIRGFLSTLLSVAGYRVLVAASAEDGLALLESDAPDLVLLDVAMGGTDGLTLLRELKERPRTRHLPVWLLTARMEGDLRAKATAFGADGYMTKPFVPDVLLSSLAEHFAGSKTCL